MQNFFRRALGQILVDGKFVSRRTLNLALEEQKQTHELLGAVLVRMGVLRPSDVSAPLLIQERLTKIEDAAKLAAGQRQLLGALLVQSGKITARQLDEAIAEQQKSGDKLGEVFIRLGMLTQMQLKGLLDLQHNQQNPASNPLRLGELLVTTGQISRQQLEQALTRQKHTGRKLGEVLVSEGFAKKRQINHAVRLQKLCVNSVLAAIISMGALTATASASTVSLQWDPSPDAAVAGYKVYYEADSSTTPFQVAPLDVKNVTAATVNNLDPAHSYSFAVTAYDAAGAESAYSNVVTIPEMQAPVTSITYPANAVTVAGVVSVTADATDNVGVAKVEFYVNGVLKATDTGSPYVFSWDTTALTPGTYTLSTKAYDAAGNIGQSQSVTVTVANDLQAPTISLTSPSNNLTVKGTVSIAANAADNVGVSRVEFYLNNALLGATNMAPYAYNWNTQSVVNGVYNVTAKAYDSAGNVGLSQVVTVNVSNDVTVPIVTLTSPAGGSTVSGTVSLTASASDNVGVSKVEFYQNNTLIGSSSTAPYSFSWNTAQLANGTYTITAKAYDAAGNQGVSQSATVTVSNVTSDVTAPSVWLTSPANNSTVSGTVTISGGAVDNVAVTRVEFYQNGVLMGSDSTAPYSYSWNTSAYPNGGYILTAKAYDAAGNVAQSANTSVTVSNTTKARKK